MKAKLNKRERRAAELLAHYATCERLAAALGMRADKIDGKKISVALFKIEREAHAGATALCNGGGVTSADFANRGGVFIERQAAARLKFDFRNDENAWDEFLDYIAAKVAKVFGGVIPPAFFVNGDCRGYALKIDNDKPEGAALIAAVKMHTDWGGYGILSPEITGE